MKRAVGIMKLLMTERFCRRPLQRRPEPTAEMNDADNVEAFHAQGAHTGPLLPIYHFNALGISQLVPSGGSVLDLGSGSGQFLAYLAKMRPDLKIRGLDLAPAMVARGNRFLAEEGLLGRVSLEAGDMTSFANKIQGQTNLVCSIFSMHHLPSIGLLQSCINEIYKISRRHNTLIWIFDHVRPQCKRTAKLFPEVFTPIAPEIFKTDSCNSLMASYSFEELSEVMKEIGLNNLEHKLAKPLRFYQVHRTRTATITARPSAPTSQCLPRTARTDFRALSRLFKNLHID